MNLRSWCDQPKHVRSRPNAKQKALRPHSRAQSEPSVQRRCVPFLGETLWVVKRWCKSKNTQTVKSPVQTSCTEDVTLSLEKLLTSDRMGSAKPKRGGVTST